MMFLVHNFKSIFADSTFESICADTTYEWKFKSVFVHLVFVSILKDSTLEQIFIDSTLKVNLCRFDIQVDIFEHSTIQLIPLDSPAEWRQVKNLLISPPLKVMVVFLNPNYRPVSQHKCKWGNFIFIVFNHIFFYSFSCNYLFGFLFVVVICEEYTAIVPIWIDFTRLKFFKSLYCKMAVQEYPQDRRWWLTNPT